MILLSKHDGAWRCVAGGAKLAAREKLPGAFAFDRAAAALRKSSASGVAARDLLPLAMASSWFVNNAVTSPIFRRWLEPPAVDVWSELVGLLSDPSSDWLALHPEDRTVFVEAARVLAEAPHGAGAISKVLALLAPDAVPLMPDAALSFALGTVPPPAAPDAQSASVDALSPMLDWFTRERRNAEASLTALASAHTTVTLSSAQVLDRLLWFDSVGYRHFRTKAGTGWFWIRDTERQGVVALTTPPPPDLAAAEPLDLAHADTADAPWKDEARRALEGT